MPLNFPNTPSTGDLWTDPNGRRWSYTGSEWGIYQPYSINELTNVDTSTTPPQIGDILKWDGVNWSPTQLAFSSNDVSDITTSNFQEGDFLIYDGNNWVNSAPDPINACLVGGGSTIWLNGFTSYTYTFGYYDNINYGNMIGTPNTNIVAPTAGLYEFICFWTLTNTYTVNTWELRMDHYNSVGTLLGSPIKITRDTYYTGALGRSFSMSFNMDANDYAQLKLTNKYSGVGNIRLGKYRMFVHRVSGKI